MNSPEYLRTPELAKRLKVSARFLEKGRLSGQTPPFFKIGGVVIYHWPTVEKWLAEHERASTSDPGKAA